MKYSAAEGFMIDIGGQARAFTWHEIIAIVIGNIRSAAGWRQALELRGKRATSGVVGEEDRIARRPRSRGGEKRFCLPKWLRRRRAIVKRGAVKRGRKPAEEHHSASVRNAEHAIGIACLRFPIAAERGLAARFSKAWRRRVIEKPRLAG